MDSEGCLGLGFIVVCFILIIILFSYQSQSLTRDGFDVIETHDSYLIVEKGGHQYIATKNGMYGTRWQYEHYPDCKCKIKGE